MDEMERTFFVENPATVKFKIKAAAGASAELDDADD
jgi:hypothetical protein